MIFPHSRSIHELSENQQAILELIWAEGPRARTELAGRMGLTDASISRLTKELIAKGWLLESVNREKLKGQPRKPLFINKNASMAFGVYFSHQHIEVGLANLSGELLAKSTKELNGTNVSNLINTTRICLEEISSKTPGEKKNAVGITFSVPGDFIGNGSKINAHAYFPELMHVDLKDEIKDQLDLDVYIENDAACAALGERIYGIGQRFKNFFFLHIGHGIGSGLIIDGKLYRGHNGNSGIIGVQYPNNQPRPSGQDLLEFLNANDSKVTDFYELEGLSASRNAPLKTWINRAASQLAYGCGITSRILDPEAIIIGGRLPKSINDELVIAIQSHGFCNEGVNLPKPHLFSSSLGPNGGVIGAACFTFFQRIFER